MGRQKKSLRGGVSDKGGREGEVLTRAFLERRSSFRITILSRYLLTFSSASCTRSDKKTNAHMSMMRRCVCVCVRERERERERERGSDVLSSKRHDRK